MPLQTLENPILEPIAQVMGNGRDPTQLYWLVNSIVIEFHDDHYLILRRTTVVSNSCK